MRKINMIFQLFTELFMIVAMCLITGKDAGKVLVLLMFCCICLDLIMINIIRALHVNVKFLPTNSVAIKRLLPYILITGVGLLICM